MLRGPEGERSWDYWRNELAGELPPLALPTDRPRPPVQSFRGGVFDFSLDEETCAGLTRLAEEEGTGLFAVVAAAFRTLLHRLAGQDEIVIGSTFPGRPGPEMRDVVGYFVNTVLLRGDLAGDPSFRRLLAREARVVSGALAHQHLPFPLLVERLAPERDLGRSPLYQVLLAFYEGGAEEQVLGLMTGGGGRIPLGPLDLEPFPVDRSTSMMDLTLNVTAMPGRMGFSLQYDADLFDAVTAERWAGGLQRLLEQVSRDPDVRLSEIPLFGGSPAERAQITARPVSPPEPEGEEETGDLQGIAIVGLALRFPGAPDAERFWENLCAGFEAITFFGREELRAAGTDPALLDHPHFVRAAGRLDGVDLFDAGFFNYNAREASIIDPQQRVFLECAWEALEDAACDPETFPGPIGVYAGVSAGTYLYQLLLRRRPGDPVDWLLNLVGNDKDFLATRASYKLGLTGPSLTVQTACSTSLVAAHLACQSLLNGECDVAIAGGSSITTPQERGYLYSPSGIMSPDGHCRAFDARARGTVGGSGVGVVVLKRLEDALADGDRIRAVIRGSAVNNDGSRKAGYTAPSAEGQGRVIAEALAVAGVPPRSISYVEAHGSGTPLGDSIEIAALQRVFASVSGPDRCALGSVKTSLGHLDAAAGIAGLIKTALALEHRALPASLHFEEASPKLRLDEGPFYVNTRLSPWPERSGPRRAGVSAFGLGGTNAHLVLEEAPAGEATSASRPWQLLLLSARTPAALEAATGRMGAHLDAHPEQDFADVAFTAKLGRRAFQHRRMLVCRGRDDARAALAGRDPVRLLSGAEQMAGRPVAFAFPGLGEHYPEMARGLYEQESGFRERFDRCAELLFPVLETDLRELLYPAYSERTIFGNASAGSGPDLRAMLGRGGNSSENLLDRTSFAHPALFAVEYALAGLWMDFGVVPQAVVGYSLGEYVAACIAGVFSLEDALLLVARRARMIEELPAGAMLAVPLAPAALQDLLGPELGIAAVNGPQLSVVAGPVAAVEDLEGRLAAQGVSTRRLRTRHAFHCGLMEPVAERLTRMVAEVPRKAPSIPCLSNVTGTWLRPEEAIDPGYWARHLTNTVRFEENLAELWSEPGRILLEIGPGQSLASLALQHPASAAADTPLALPSLAAAWERQEDQAALLTALGRLWLTGVRVDWRRFYAGERRRHAALPTYPFERQRYWFDESAPSTAQPETFVPAGTSVHARPNLANAYAAPETALEKSIAGLWQELLGIDQIGRHDSFFALGGHSLLATQVISRLVDTLGIELSLEQIFTAPTVAELAGVIAAAGVSAESEAPPRPPIPRRPDPARAPLSFAQQRLWFIDQLTPGSPLYNVPVPLRVEGPLDARVLARCLGEVVRRHESLRTVFAVEDDTPVQVIRPAVPFALPVADLSTLPEGRREAEALRLAGAEAVRPFDLASTLQIRAALLRLAADDHLVALTLHHIVSDSWSIGILVREVTALYAAFAQGKPSLLPELPVQYADFAAWQSSWLQGETLEAEIAFWRDRLAGLPPLLDLPTDRPRPATLSHRGASRPVRLPAPLARQAEALGRREGATLFMVLLAGFQTLLSRVSGQDDLAVGAPVAGRNRVEVEGLIGFFVNTLVLRGDLAERPSFRELLSRARETALAAYRHQEVPFEKLVQELSVERRLDHSPLFQVMLVLQNAPGESLEVENLRLRLLDRGARMARFDLTLDLIEEANGELSGEVEHSTDLFDAATVDRLMGSFERLLAGALAEPDTAVAELELLSPAERHQLFAEWNDTGEPRPGGNLLHDLFAAQAVRTPDAPAVLFGAETLSYAGLAHRSATLARRLRELGCGPETRVGVALERSLELPVALLGVLEAGAAYVPLDPGYPPERLAFVLEDVAPRVMITESSLQVLDQEDGASLPGDDLQLAYVLYTSGSTGRPKGVGVSHRALVNFLGSMQEAPGFAPGEKLLAVTSLSFDIAALEIFLPLVTGGCVELASREETTDGALLAERLRASGAGVLQATPATWRMLLDAGWVGDPELKALCGGEALPRDLAETLAGRTRELWNLYGPTETTVWSAAVRVHPEETGPVSIGRPIANTRIHLLDRELQAVPLGVHGELFIGGDGLARGYLGRPDLTAERFVPDPLGSGSRLYRTGDLARHLPGGRMEVLGRIDHQVKLRGFRIELGEIEAALARHPEIREAVVALRGGRLIAYVVLSAVLDPGDLRGFLRTSLPEPMIPAIFVSLDALPLTPNRKVDRKALPDPGPSGETRDFVSPRTPGEEVVAGIWTEVLGRERVGVHDSFFDLGGHSLLATRVAARLRGLFGVELPLRVLFERPTVAELAAAVEDARRCGTGPGDAPLVPVPRTGDLPLSFAQERLWFLDRLEPGGTAYNFPLAVRLSGPLDLGALATAYGEILHRHEALRTTFAEADGEPVQRISPPAVPALPAMPVIDLSGLPTETGRAAAERLLKDEARRPFDLAQGPLARLTLFRLGPTEHLALLGMHHIVTDGWSIGVLMRDLTTLYSAAVQGTPSPLPELPVQPADHAVWQRGRLRDETLAAELAWWRGQLEGAPPFLDLPFDRPARADFRAGQVTAGLSPERTAALEAFSRRQGATLFMTLLAGWSALLSRSANQEDVLIGSPIANRTHLETEGLVGFFANTLVLRTDLSGDPGGGELVARVRRATLDAYDHQEMPFERLVQEIQPERDPTRSPLVQVFFVLQNAPQAAFELPDLRLELLPLAQESAKIDLSLILDRRGTREIPGGLSAALEYRRDLCDEAAAERLLEHWRTLLDGLVENPEARVAELSPLSAAERRQVTSHPAASDAASTFTAPRTDLERTLAAVWSEILGADRVGLHDDFFDLGGHSLLATRMMARIETRLGVVLPLRALFETPTVAGLASRIEQASGGEVHGRRPPLAAGPRPADLPLSFAQERLWLLDQIDGASAIYNIPCAVQLSGALDPAALGRALDRVVRRHEALRTRFEAVAGEPRQVVEPPRPVPLPSIDLTGASEDQMFRAAAAEAVLPFDLTRPPLLRACLLRRGAEDHLLVLTLHHIAADGWSLGVLVREIATFYQGAFYQGEPLEDLPLQYADLALWQRRWLAGETLAQEVAWWRERLAGAPEEISLPFDRPRVAAPSHEGGSCLTKLAPPAGLATLCRERQATLFMAVLAAFSTLLSRWGGDEDLVVGTPVAGRDRAEIEGLIGFFVNMLPLRVDLAGQPTFSGLLERVRETALAAYAHQDLPFEKIVEALKPARHLGRTPLFQVSCALQSTPFEAVEIPGLSWSPLALGTDTAKFDLSFSLAEEDDGGLSADLEYNAGLFERTTALRLLEHFRVLLAGAAADPGLPLWDLPLLSDAERRQAIAGWNETRTVYPREATIQELFEARVEESPDAVAVIEEELRWTYRELNARANRLAHHLRRLGVVPETPVGICLERSAEQIAVILGILKAGGVYVPLDPAYPADRLRFMLSDSDARFVVSRQPLIAELPLADAQWIDLDQDADALERQSAENPEPAGSAEHLAYVMYTSGSTGVPKGVAVVHRSVVRLVRATNYARLGPEEVFLQLAPASFDASTFEIWGALLNGALLAIPPGRVLSLRELGDAVARHGVTTLWLTAGLFHQMVDERLSALAGVRQLLAGGDVLMPGHVRRVLEELPGCTLINGYGPTENTTFTCCQPLTAPGDIGASVPIGRPIANTRVQLLDRSLQPVPDGVPGELYTGGAGLARGYLGRPALTAERFVPDPFGEETGEPGGRLYRTGDLARRRTDGAIEFLGRIDGQVKIRGFRVEPGEIEARLGRHPGLHAAAVTVYEAAPGDKRIAACLVAASHPAPTADELRRFLRASLPEHMVPSAWIWLSALPLTPNGKVNRKALPRPETERPAVCLSQEKSVELVAPRPGLERTLAALWSDVLGTGEVGLHDNFFDLGGHSLLLVRMQARLAAELGREVPVVELFRHPTVASLAAYLENVPRDAPRPSVGRRETGTDTDIAVIALEGRFPGAPDLDRFWENLRDGVESIERLTDEQLLAAGIDPRDLESPGLVRAEARFEGLDLFDAAFFGINPREAQALDPQQRVFLELAWACLERAGYDPGRYPGRIGVFAGSGAGTYAFNVFSDRELCAALDPMSIRLAVEKDFLATRVSYKLDLRGPAVSVQTACSTSLVAVHFARQSLLTGECDMAMAGGVTLKIQQGTGYRYLPGGIESPDGHCRAFDAAAQGTLLGSGAGIVLLKRLDDALRDGDTIRAVLKGSAINNDGGFKVGFTAPSVEGQEEVVAAALASAGVSPESISYVEAHGTATALGDPIEVSALTRAFRRGRRRTERTGFCSLGSVKTNIGHLDAAAGIAGLIKTVLALEHRQIPPSLHFESPNPAIDFPASPFRVAGQLAGWETDGAPRRAGVSSFGIGGTNAHAVLEEAPPAEPSGDARPVQLLLLSARTSAALEESTVRLADWLESHPEVPLADVAFTLRVGRRPFEHRRMLVCTDREEALAALRGRDPERLLSRRRESVPPPTVWLLPGQGSQHPGMGRDLYETEPVFRREIDASAAILALRWGLDLHEVLFSSPAGEISATRFAQPALFAVEHALARWWISLGVRPHALIGHSLGEYVAACLAGVFSVEDALMLVALRGELMQELPPGAMLSVDLMEADVLTEIAADSSLSLAAVNGPRQCVVSGSIGEIEALTERLGRRSIPCRRLHTSHAFHSPMMEPILGRFAEALARVELRPPSIPYLSNLTGTWITAAEATNPQYWVRHLRETVRFGDGVSRLLADLPEAVLLETGPGRALGRLVRGQAAGRTVLSSMPHPGGEENGAAALLQAAGRLWLAGVEIEWTAFQGDERRRRVPLPTYPFQRLRFWTGEAAPDGESSRSGQTRPGIDTPYAAPGTETERRLATIWGDLLGIDQVGVHDDFFELGGHSLLATRLLSRLRDAFGREVALATIFDEPTIARLAASLQEDRTGTAVSDRPPLVPVPRDSPVPLSFAQQRLWFIDQLEPGSPLYNMPVALRAEGPLDARVLALALGEIARRHEALRTVFTLREGAPVQVIRPAIPFLLPVVDLSGLPEGRRESLALDLAGEEAGRPFDLARDPLLRGVLLRQAEADHAVLLTVHHIASDGWSMGILVREVVALYAAFSRTEPSPLPELPVQYADFAAWQTSWLRGETLENEVSFWRDRLAGLPPLLELPTDHPRPAMQSFRGAARPVRLPAGLIRMAEGLGRKEGATLYMVLLAGFQTLLARYSGQNDLAVGSPVAGRNRAEIEDLIGFFVNTLVLRGDLSGEPTVRELLGRTRETALAAHLHQDVPFEKLVQELAPERNLAHSPLFQVVLVLQNAPFGSLEIESLRLRPGGGEGTTAKFDLTFNLEESGGGLSGIVEYATDLFDAATVDRLILHFERLLAGMAGTPERRLVDLDLLTPDEALQLRAGNEAAHPLERPLQAWIEDLAGLFPDSVAVTCEAEALTYGELERRANRLARHLLALGVGPEIRVAVLMERSAELVVALLAVLKTGGAYVPLDLAYPAERIAFLLEDSAAAVLLTEGRLDADRERIEAFSGERLLVTVDPAQLAYVIYTSGSTGRPKGVQVTHANAGRLFASTRERFRFGPEDVWTFFHSAAFDFSVWEIWGALIHGGRLVVVPWDVSRSPDRFLDLLVRERVTVLNQTPSAFTQLAREDESRGGVVSDLRLVIFGGEALDLAGLAPWFSRHGDTQPLLVNMYGITETTVHVTVRPLCLSDARSETRSLIGLPIPDLSLTVMDRGLRPAPLGVPGELAVGGAGLSRGYLGRPELTAERFVPDPLTEIPGARLYRSGDLGRLLPRGDVEYLGRIDQQVKIRGFRIELGEVEAALTALDGVREAAVSVREDRLIAYVVGDAEPTVLRAALRERLPDYMIPAAFVTLTALPLTSHGKVDRKALPAPEGPSTSEGYVAPRTPVEEVLAGLWAELLGLEQVGATDHFFDLGGHSLLATRLMSRLRTAFGVEIPLRDLFEAPVLGDLSVRVETALRTGTGPAAPPLVPVRREAPLPLSFAQQRLWFIDQLEPGSPLYNMPVTLRAEGPLDVRVLALALGEITRRHEALRTVFAPHEGVPVQVIQPAAPFFLPVVDLSGLPKSLALDLAGEEARRPFDLARDPLLRGLLLRLAPADHVILLTLHHIASDGWSMGILVREVVALYAAFAQGRPSPLPELPVQYADFAVWQASWLHGETLENEVSYWRNQLAGLPPLLELPTDRPRPAVQSYRGAMGPVRLPAGLVRRAETLGRREGATLFMVLLAGFQALLARYSGQADLAVGSPVAGRNRAEIEDLIGFFVNTLVLRGDLTGSPSFRDLLGRTRETALAAYLHQDVPFEKLVEEIAPERSLAHTPLFQVMLVLQNAPTGNLEVRDLRLRPVSAGWTTAKFDLTVSLSEQDGGLIGTAEHATDLYDGTTVERLLGHFERLLAAAVSHPEEPAAALPLSSPEEREQILVELNDTAAPLAHRAWVYELFETQVRRTPEAAAIVLGNEVLTYAGLAARAGGFARRLRRLGVGPDVPVGLMAERSLDMAAGLLGILQAGGAYVPLDPAYPQQRLAFMFGDTGAPVLLTQAHLRGRLPAGGAQVLLLDGEAETGGDPDTPGGEPAGENLAYVIYTSGSTGRPKGVALSHLALLNLIDWHLPLLLGGARTLQFASLSFDASFHEMFACWGSGGTLVVVPEEPRRDMAALAGLLVEQEVEKVVLPVVVLQQLAEIFAGREVLPPLREITTTGERLQTNRAMAALLRRLPGSAFHNHYGPSETHVATAFTLSSDPDDWPVDPPIGRPIANSTTYVLEPGLVPAPLGVPGDLYIGGACLARGYLGRPELTAQRFVPDPFGGEPGARLYRTGDKVRLLARGDLEYMGRFDDQVKIRGFRIEPGEIETLLLSLPGVREAAVAVRQDGESGERRLVAWVVADVPAAELRRMLRNRLPDYMMPSAFVALAALPLTNNGKVDRRALPAPDREPTEETYLPPRTAVEEILCGLWAEVLGLERVGAGDQFFDLGGHSLLAARVMSRLRGTFGVEMPLRDLFAAPRLADLAVRVEAARRAANGPAAPPLVRVSRTGPVPLSYPQERLWFLYLLEPESAAFHLGSAVRLSGALVPEALAAGLGETVRRHEVLRTRYRESGAGPVQVIDPPAPFFLPLADLGALPQSVRESELRRLAEREMARPFDLTRDQPLRALLVRLSREEHAALFTLHHIAGDGWSLGLLNREVGALYAGFSAGKPSPLPEPAVQYADFAVWQRGWLSGERLEAELDWWRHRLAGPLPVLEMPQRRERPDTPGFRGAAILLTVPADLRRSLERIGRAEGATLFMTLLAAFKALLHLETGQKDLLVATNVANRDRGEIEGLIGFFVNNLVLRTSLSGDPGFRELVRRVRDVTLGAFVHQEVPFEKVLEAVHPRRQIAFAPLFQAMFLLDNFPVEAQQAGSLEIAPLEMEARTASFDLTLRLREEEGGLSGALQYDTDLYPEAAMARLAEHYLAVLHGVAEDPDRPVSDLSLTGESEIRELASAFSEDF